MRLWSLHPKYLDVKGLLALWREGLLAKKVLSGYTRAYRNHPQLNRFKEVLSPYKAIDFYLKTIYEESRKRGYCFDGTKIELHTHQKTIPVRQEQVIYEKSHLENKLLKRAPSRLSLLKQKKIPDIHPLFTLIEGEIEDWERINIS